MNKTQELITDNFTIGHAKQTVESLLEKTQELSREISLLSMHIEVSSEESEQMMKYQKIERILKKSLNVLRKTEKIINNIDEKPKILIAEEGTYGSSEAPCIWLKDLSSNTAKFFLEENTTQKELLRDIAAYQENGYDILYK